MKEYHIYWYRWILFCGLESVYLYMCHRYILPLQEILLFKIIIFRDFFVKQDKLINLHFQSLLLFLSFHSHLLGNVPGLDLLIEEIPWLLTISCTVEIPISNLSPTLRKTVLFPANLKLFTYSKTLVTTYWSYQRKSSRGELPILNHFWKNSYNWEKWKK